MSITVITSDPAALLAAIKRAIDDKHIETWEYDRAGDFTHSPDQFRCKAWLAPTIGETRLVFGIIGRNDETLKRAIYGIYHGRFIEMLLNHFDKMFLTVFASALLDEDDIYRAGP
jgi:hypothetical protein